MPKIVSTATAFPEHFYSQDELIGALRSVWSQRHHNLDRLEQFHRNVLVGGRHLALPLEEYENLKGFGASNDAWIRSALALSERTLRLLLEKGSVHLDDIGILATTTVTGIAVPSLDARLMNRIAFPHRLKRMPLFGLGCVGGAAGLSRVADYLQGFQDEAGILLSVELCSLTLQREDLSVANIVSSGLFGDGAAAVLCVGDEHPLAKNSNGPRIIDTRSIFFPETERVMGWDMVDSGFQIVLDHGVPGFARDNLRPGLDAFLGEHELALDDIDVWIAHPGGPKVIDAMEAALELASGTLDSSRESLSRVGNLSSASVLNILEETLEKRTFRSGDRGILLAMGPAFCAEVLLLEWD